MKIRQLNPLENLFAVCHDYFAAHSVVCFRIKIIGYINETAIRQALDKIQRDNILLQACILQQGFKRVFYKQASFIPIPLIVIKKTTDEQWKDFGYSQIQKKFDTKKGPLAKLFLLTSVDTLQHDMLLIAHHAIIDTKSAVFFFDNLLQNYCVYIKTSSHNIASQSDVAVDYISINCHQQTSYKKSTSKDKLLDISYFMLSENSTSILITKCRENNTSIFGMFAALCLKSIQTEIGYKKTFFGVVPIDMRQHYFPPIDEKELGCYISAYKNLAFDPSTHTEFWELARRYKNLLNNGIKNPSALKVYFPTNRIVKFIFIVYYKIKKFLAGFATNNIGLLVINNCGKYSLSHTYNSLSIEGFSWFANITFLKKNRFFVNIITINGKLCITLRSSFKNTCNKIIAQKFLESLEKIANDESI
jgi:hypothetical protein